MASGGGKDAAPSAATPTGDWERHVDDESGATYYFSRSTGESSWEVPEGFVAAAAEGGAQENDKQHREPPRWRRFTDDDSGKAYFYDEANGETQWEEPEGFVGSEDSNSDGEQEESEGHARPESEAEGDEAPNGGDAEPESAQEASADGSHSSDKPDTEKAAVAVAPPSSKGAAASAWTKYMDATTGKPYFYNAATRVTQWEEPSEYEEAAGSAPVVSAEYQAHLVRVQTERLSRVTQQVLDPTGSLSKLNAILSGINGGASAESTADEPDGDANDGASREKAEWQQHVDPQTQRYYYYNVVTGVTQWQKPNAAIASGLADWIPPEIPEEDAASRKTVSGVNYVSHAKFNRLTGKYEKLDTDEYWDSVGAPTDRAGRQMSHFFDVNALEQNREEARRKAEALKRKNVNWKKVAAEKKAKKLKQKNEWIYTD